MSGDVAILEWLANLGLRLDRRQRSGHAALHKAAEMGRLDVCRRLLSQLTVEQLAQHTLLPEESEAAANDDNDDVPSLDLASALEAVRLSV